MKKLYKRAFWTASVCFVLASSYFVLKAVVANPSAAKPRPSDFAAQGGNSSRAITPISSVSEPQGGKSVNVKDMYTQLLSRIKAARDSRDINQIVKLGDEIELSWRDLDVSQYASLMLEVCNALSSTNLNDDNQYLLEQKYASLVLYKQLGIPADIEAQLMLHLQEDIEYAKGQLNAEQWAERRRNKTELWLRTWQHLNSAIDPNFDFTDLPLENVPLPRGAVGVAGMAPEEIKDPALRAQYQNAVDANKKKAEDFRIQSALYKVREIFNKRMEAYLIRSYSRPPDNRKEVELILKKYPVDENMRERILSSIKLETSDARSN